MHTENTVYMRGSKARIFQLAADIQNWPEILPHYREVLVFEQTNDGTRKVVEMAAVRADFPFKGQSFPVRWQSVQICEPETDKIYFKHLAGVALGMWVVWTLEDDPWGRGIAVTISHDLSYPLPFLNGWFARDMVGEQFVHAIAGRTLATIKAIVERDDLRLNRRLEAKHMMIPDDVGIVAFHGNANLKATVLERLKWYETEGDTSLKRAMLQEKWSRQAQHGLVFNPYPKIVRAADIAELRISGDVSTLYALGVIEQSHLYLIGDDSNSRIYLVNYFADSAFEERLGVLPTMVSLLSAISKGLPPEREASWLRQFWAAVPVGASLWQVPMQIVLWALSDSSHGILGLSDAAAQTGEDDRGIKALRDILTLYRGWVAGGRAGRQDWFSFVTSAEAAVKSSRRQSGDGEYVYDLPAPERYCLRATAGAARTADVEEESVIPLPAGIIARQLPGDSLRAPGNAIYQAGLYASERGIVPSIWYETCAGVLLDILANCPVPDRPNEQDETNKMKRTT